MNNELEKYIAGQKAAGFSNDEISKILTENGYTVDVIKHALGDNLVPPPPIMSQTGSPGSPIQIENVQYAVDAKDYKSKPALIFIIANLCMALGLFMLASLLFNLTGKAFGFSDEVSSTVQLVISTLIPTIIIGYLAIKRLNVLLESSPAALEDLKFKSRLRKSFLFFLTLSGLGSVVAIFNFIGIFIGTDDKVVQNQFFALYYVGGLIIMTLWLYSYQRKTTR